VLANTYDGALDESGEPIKIGLRREEGNPLVDHRIMDGFGACIRDGRLSIKYHAEIPLKEVHSNGFEGEMESMVEKVKSFLQKEYKKVTKSSLSLSDPSEVDAIGGMPTEPEREIDKEFENFAKLGGLKS
jgi:hypothetical protein